MSNACPVPFSLSRLGQAAIPVRDLDRAVPFYCEVLSMEFLFQARPKLAFFDGGVVRLPLDASAGRPSENRSTVLYFRVDDIAAAHTILTERGVEFAAKPHAVAKLPDRELWMAFFYDLDRNLLALMAEVRR